MAVELNLKLKDLTWLGKAFENNSIISPFTLINQADFNEEDKNRLVQSGIIDKENNIKADYFPLLDILSKADGFIETRFKRGPVQARKLIMTAEDRKLSLVYKDDEAVINMPANPVGMAEYLREFTGGSKLTGGDLSLEADGVEIFIFAAACDLYRRDVLKAYSEEEVFIYKGFTAEELLAAVNTIRDNSQSLAYHVFAVNNGFAEFSMDILAEFIESLEEKALIINKDNKYYPIGEGLLFAGNFLIIENIIELTVGQVKQGLLYRSGFTMLQAGPLDILYIEASAGKIIMQCMSADNAISLISTVLSQKPQI